MKMKARGVATLAAALTIATIRANCPSFCSGNGICGADDKCSCHQAWGGPDCSLRQCAFALAWADTADGTNQAHYYAECANKGICDRKSGLCQCFAGYEGKGCRRSSCPEDCSGHGTCEYIEELAGDYQDRRNGPGHFMQDMSCKDLNAFPSKTGAFWSGTVDLSTMADTNLLVVSNEQINGNSGTSFYANAYTGMPVVYSSGVGGTKATALTEEGTYYLYKTTTANTFVVFTTEAQARKTDYVDPFGTAAKAATGALDIKTGTAASGAHIFTEANRDSCYAGSITTSNHVARTANSDVQHGYMYNEWDAGMMQGCRCDLGYDGPDCGHRIPPYGDDPLTTVKSNAMKQAIKIYGAAATTFVSQEFIMVYHDPYGGIWRSSAIDGTDDDDMVSSRVQNALRTLPNEVLDGVKVTGTASTPTICHRFSDGLQHYGAATQYHVGHGKDAKYRANFCKNEGEYLAPASNDMDFTIEFNKLPGQTGVQYLFEVDISKRGAGSYPLSAGITGSTSYSVAEISYNHDIGNISELAECSDRGLDDGEGQCECFDGFRGLACQMQEALV